MVNPQSVIRCSAVASIKSRKRASNGASNGWTSFVSRVKLRPSSRATMCRPGSTHRSWAVSNTRIRSSSSSNFILPPLDHEVAPFLDPDVMEFIEPLVRGGKFHPARRAQDATERNLPVSRPLLVPPPAVLDSGLEVVAHHPEAGILRRPEVDRPLGPCRVRVVHHEPLAGLDARRQETLLPVPGLQHVQVDPQVRVEEPILVEGRFAGPLEADEDHGFHGLNPRSGLCIGRPPSASVAPACRVPAPPAGTAPSSRSARRPPAPSPETPAGSTQSGGRGGGTARRAAPPRSRCTPGSASSAQPSGAWRTRTAPAQRPTAGAGRGVPRPRARRRRRTPPAACPGT